MPLFGALMGLFLLSGAAVATMPQTVSAPQHPATPGFMVTLTAYNAVPEQTDGDPLVTASGAFSNPEVVAARSRDLGDTLPFGTIIALDAPTDESNTCGYSVVGDAIGYRVIADTMNARYTDRVDVLFDTSDNYVVANGTQKNAGTILGICPGVTVHVVGHVDITNPRNLPKSQAALAALVTGKSSLAVK